MAQEITLDKLIDRGSTIKEKIKKAPTVPGLLMPTFYRHEDPLEYETWKNDTIRYLHKYYPNDISIQRFSDGIINFEKNHNSPQRFIGLIGILISCKNIPQVADKKRISENIGPQVHVHQHQSQQQSQTVQIFLEMIKDELTGKQAKELKSIVKEELPETEKRIKIIDKLKSFGSDVSANIIANIVTNPAVWG